MKQSTTPDDAAAGNRTLTARSSKKSSARKKTFVLDTNVLLHNPTSIHRFEDNEVVIPVDCLAELDRFKNEQSDRGANARQVHRALNAAFTPESGADVTKGVPTPGGGTLRLQLHSNRGGAKTVKKPVWLQSFEETFPETEKIDHRIIAAALRLHHAGQKNEVILVTKDINMQLKARAVGLVCEDYQNDKVSPSDVSSYDLRRVEVISHELQRFASGGELALEDPDRLEGLTENEYVLLSAGPKTTMPARFAGNTFRRLLIPKSIRLPGGTSISPINLGQQCLLDALLDPSVSLVTCYGHAGTGKTLLAVAAGLHSVFEGVSRGLTVSRPVVAMGGETLGYLPGTLDEKMRPWLQPIYDALEFLLPPTSGGNVPSTARKKGKAAKAHDLLTPSPGGTGSKPHEALIEKGIVEIEALCYIRGRSIPQRYFVLDEAQQLTPLEAKTVVTRMSKNSKLIMVGDPAQIDNPYVDSRSNGLVYTRNRLRGHATTAHVSLSKGERSKLAELGATLM